MSGKQTLSDFEEFFDTTKMSMIIVQDIVKIVYANHTFFESSGYEPEDLNYTTLTDLIHKDDLHLVQERIKLLEKGEKPEKMMQLRIIRKDETVALSRIHAYDITFNKKKSRILVGINISAEPLIEQSPELVSSLLQTLTKHSQLGFWVDDINDHTIYINDRMCEFLGYTFEEISNRSITDFFHPDSQELYYQVLKERTEKNLMSSSYELVLINKDGRPSAFRVIGSLLFDRKLNPIGTVGFFTNIEATKKLSLTVSVLNKYALFSRYKDLSSFWENVLSDLIEIYSTEGGLVFLDGETVAQNGYFSSKFNPQAILEELAKSGENVILLRDNFADISNDTSSCVVATLHLNQLPAGFILLNSSINNLFIPEDIDLITAFCSQISLNYEHHFLYLQSEEEREYVSVLLDIISHDFLNANTSVHGYLELLDQSAGTLEPEKLREYVKRSISVVERSERILQTVQQLTKIQTERKAKRLVYIKPLLENAIELQKTIFHSKSMNLKLDCPKNENVFAGDLLENVFENVINNSLKYSDDDIPKIDITCQSLKIDGQNMVEMRFTDYGIGIPDDVKPMFFKRLSRGDHRFQKGTGLGLYMARVIINSYSGEIRFENRVANDYTKGTVVVILLPTGE
ncbi:MAG: PAS domain S-box protein [Candidatus Heimdallarchaeota archaeon]|nr:PAS domain S-box protein [Candidatus Heimdallarchaeota archaeon]